MKKKKLTIQQQINHMKNRNGIKFNIMDETEAEEFLKYNNYYFKLKSYAKNYDKYSQGRNKGKYINLEFAYLVELSTIDMYFRRIILKITLDIEHYLKTKILRDFNQNNYENGYDIVEDLFKNYPYITDNISRKKNNSACADLILKYENNFSLWSIVEVLSFSDFTKLYSLYYSKYPAKSSVDKYLWSVRFLRNAAAHNTCLLNSLKIPYSKKIKPNKNILNTVSKIESIGRSSRSNKMINPVVHDFVVTLDVFNNIVTSKKIKINNMKDLKELFEIRVKKNEDFFNKNDFLGSYYNFFSNIVDYYYQLCV